MRTFFLGLHSRILGKIVFVPSPKTVYAPPSHTTLVPNLLDIYNFLKKVILAFVTLHQKKKKKIRGSYLKNDWKNKG